MMRELPADLRYGCRLLLKNPGVTAVAVLALALGIGANTAIFSAVNAVLLRPLPFPDPGRLVSIRVDHDQRNIHNAFGPYPDIAEWRRQSRSFEFLSAYSPSSVNLTTRDEPERASLWKVNAVFFPLLGVKMALGRGFLPEEDQPGAARVAILSHSLWERRFGSDPSLVSKAVFIDGDPYTVVGVLTPEFHLETGTVDLYTPVAASSVPSGRDRWMYGAYARLKPGVPIEKAQAELDTITRRLEQQRPRQLTGWRARVWGMREFIVRDVKLSLVVLLAAVALVLLIACANVANLLLARAGARQKEMAVRAAMGAGRGRVVRQLLTESVLLALLGAVFGLLLAYWGVAALPALGTERFPMLQQSRLDLPVLGFTLLISLLTGLLFGIAPALAVSRTKVYETLKEGGRASTESRARHGLRGLLVVSEVALALLLMIGASLMVRSLLNLQDVNPGFNPAGVLTASVNLPASKYSKPDQQTAFYRRLQERLEAMPGVAAAGMTSVLPLIGSNQGTALFIQGRPVSSPSDLPILWFRIVNTKYFQAMQIPLRKGRLFTEQDAPGAPRALIVNETMARRYWPNEDPIGKQVGNGRPDGWVPVVGVVGDVRHMSLAQEPDAEIYYPFAQSPQPAMSLALRTSSDPLRFAPALRQAVLEIDREQPVSRVASMEQTLAGSLAAKRFSTVLLGIFAVVALVLATIGIYGVISFSVTRRTHEIGIRMALGARGADVLRMVVLRGTLLALLGVFVGLAAAFALTRVIGSLLYGVRATDTLIFSAVSLLLIAVAALASYLPARRAARVDPMVALRYE
ncbi:MAG: ABC transporter permease [Bryobacteraceae bacterium]|jgi:putative ABC transport system permease protein